MKPIPLGAVRDLLMPGCRGFDGRNRDTDTYIQVESRQDCLLIKMHSRTSSLSRVVICVISREDLESNVYKAKFSPALNKMRELLFDDKQRRLATINLSEVRDEIS
jgi:hypothetical protein